MAPGFLLDLSEEQSKEPTKQPGCTYGEIHFLVRDPLYESEKPYGMRYPPEGDLKQRNLLSERHKVNITNYRECSDKLNFDKCGFEVMKMQTKMRYEDFDDDIKLGSIYAPELCHALKERFGAKHVYVMDYALRKRHSTFPTSTGTNYKDDQPTSSCHIDFTPAEGERCLRLLYRDHAEEVLRAHWQVINVWKPIKDTVRDWPLAICDAASLNQEDAIPGDIVYPNWVTENMQVHHNEDQKWYYLPDQEVDECWIFKNVDSAMESGGQCPHSAFADPNTRANDPPRESIDVRAFVLYADLEPFPPEIGDDDFNKPDYRGISLT